VSSEYIYPTQSRQCSYELRLPRANIKMSNIVIVNGETFDCNWTHRAYFYLYSKSLPVEKLNIKCFISRFSRQQCLVQIGYKDGSFKEYYIETRQYYDIRKGDHVIDDMTNVLVVIVSMSKNYFDLKGILVEELKKEFLRSLTQDLCTPPELEDVKANFDKVLAGLTEEKFSLTTQPQFECTNFNREMFKTSVLCKTIRTEYIDDMENFFMKKQIPLEKKRCSGIEKVFTFDDHGNVLNFNDYYYHVNGYSTIIKVLKEEKHVADIFL